MIRIGSWQSDITPSLPVPMGGSFLKNEGREVLDPLLASCVVADDGSTRVAIVSCDLGSVPQDMTLAIRDRVQKATGTAGANIHLMATHDHACPTVFHDRDLPFHEDDNAFSQRRVVTRGKLVDKISECVIKAHDNLVPASIGYGRGCFEKGVFNRRFIMSNGRSMMYGGNKLVRLKAEGPVDPEVQLVSFKDKHGRYLALMLNYSSHPDNLYGKSVISADFPGVIRKALQDVLGQNLPILYLQGACGNVVPRDLDTPNSPRGMENVLRVGQSLAGEALKIMGNNYTFNEQASVSVCNRILQIPYREDLLPPGDVQAKRAYCQNHWDEFRKLDIEERAALLTTLRLQRYRQTSMTEAVEIAAFALGDVLFVTNQAELFVEYQLDIKQYFRSHKVIVTELTNGRIGYVPTKLACALGGYETIETRFNPGAGDLIRDTSCELIAKLLNP